MHGGCGMWGLLATGLLGEVTSVRYFYGPSAYAGGFYRQATPPSPCTLYPAVPNPTNPKSR